MARPAALAKQRGFILYSDLIRQEWQLSEWELLLQRLSLPSDEAAIEELKIGGVAGAQLRSWLDEFAYRRFVPESVLDVIGLKISVSFRFPWE